MCHALMHLTRRRWCESSCCARVWHPVGLIRLGARPNRAAQHSLLFGTPHSHTHRRDGAPILTRVACQVLLPHTVLSLGICCSAYPMCGWASCSGVSMHPLACKGTVTMIMHGHPLIQSRASAELLWTDSGSGRIGFEWLGLGCVLDCCMRLRRCHRRCYCHLPPAVAGGACGLPVGCLS